MGLINPPKKKKCYAPSGAGNSVVEAYLDLIEKISSKPKKSKFLELKTLLADQKDNVSIFGGILKLYKSCESILGSCSPNYCESNDP